MARRIPLVGLLIALAISTILAVVALGQSPGEPTVKRLDGPTRFETAVAISQHQFPAGADAVYLARADVLADAVAAGTVTGGPILLLPSCGALPAAVRNELARLDPTEVIALGGEAALCDETVSAAATAGYAVTEGAGIITVPSDDSVDATVERITDAVQAGDASVVATIDHAQAAADAGLELRPTTLLLVGNPAAGTPLMQASQTAAIDLPQKLLVYEDATGDVHVAYNDPAYLAARHDLTGQDQRLSAIADTLRALATGG